MLTYNNDTLQWEDVDIDKNKPMKPKRGLYSDYICPVCKVLVEKGEGRCIVCKQRLDFEGM